MRIMQIITRLVVGGAQENTLLTCRGLNERGHEVILITGPSLGPEGSLLERAQSEGYRVIVCPHLVRNPHPWHDLMAYRAIKRWCRQLQPEVVHTHSSKAGIIGRAAARAAGVRRVIHTIHGLPFHPYQAGWMNKLWVGLERWAARRCDHILCVADAMTRQARAAGVGHEGQFTTVYSGMEVEPFLADAPTRVTMRQELGIPADRLVMAVVARLQPLKGHDDLLAITPELFAAYPQAHWLWIGDGVYRARFEAHIRGQGWQDRFTLTGLVPPARIAPLLKAADLLVHPSYREGLARALPQALLSGLPVVSYDCDGAAEVCQPGRTGVLVPTGNQKLLARGVGELLADGDLRQRYGQAGRDWCRRRFDWRVMVEEIEKSYDL